jgi:hypothetical protein
MVGFTITRQEYEGTNAWCPFCERNEADGLFYCKKKVIVFFSYVLCEDLQCDKKGKGGTIER